MAACLCSGHSLRLRLLGNGNWCCLRWHGRECDGLRPPFRTTIKQHARRLDSRTITARGLSRISTNILI
jgi:hypothetical protein